MTIDSQVGEPPSLEHPVSQVCTEAQCLSRPALEWIGQLREPLRLHRKQWEYAYILQCLALRDKLRPGQRGIGFGVGREPLPALLASRGSRVTATDLPFAEAASRGWQDYNSPEQRQDALNGTGLCPPAEFKRLVEFVELDMNAFDPRPDSFDFAWSSCALEHLGSLENGIDFVLRTLRCLRPGGVAVHTTEFNLSSDSETLTTGSTVLYRRRDLERLAAAVSDCGMHIQFNWDSGDGPADGCIDRPPYRDAVHLKLEIGGFVCTSIGIVIDRP